MFLSNKFNLIIYASLTLSIGCLNVPAFAKTVQKCVKVDKMDIADLFDRWNRSLQTGDPTKVAKNYVSDAVLLPTLSKIPRLTDSERREYFKEFLIKEPVGRIDSRTIRLGCNKAVDTGTYTFSFKDASKVSARYTFTYFWNGSRWLITTHHSSVTPDN